MLLEDIQRHASLAADDKEKYTAYLMWLSEKEWIGEKAAYTKEADQCQRRISDERFASLSVDYEAESRKLKDRYNEIQTLLANYAQQSRDAKEFAALVEQYTNITELTKELLHTLIEKVIVHEKEVIDGETDRYLLPLHRQGWQREWRNLESNEIAPGQHAAGSRRVNRTCGAQ